MTQTAIRTRRPPMDKFTAMAHIAEMRAKTKSKKARRIVLNLALGPHGNLSEEAKAVYRAALNEPGFVE